MMLWRANEALGHGIVVTVADTADGRLDPGFRQPLIARGMAYSPGHGDTAFTVPLFDGFMKRIMPAL